MPREIDIRSIKEAIKIELQRQHLTHKQVADLLGLKKSTVDNKLSICDFSEREAQRWSAALNISADLFLYGAEHATLDNYTELKAAYQILRQEVDELKVKVAELEGKIN